MKNILRSFLLFCPILMLLSCEREIDLVNKVSPTDGLAFVKFIHASPNFRQVYNGRDSFNIYVDDVKVNGSFLTYNSMYPSATNLYAAVPAGSHTIRLTINGTLTPDSLTLVTINKTVEAGNYYSFIVTDEALSANESRQMWIKDDFALTDTNNFTVRFVHAALKEPGGVDVYSFQKGAKIFSNIAAGTATPFITLPYTLQTDTLYIRAAGTLTDILKFPIINGSTTAFNRTRAYTLLYKGQNGLTAKGRSLAFYANN